MTERRSLRSRFFRYTTNQRNAKEAVVLMCAGWTMTILAGTNPMPDETSVHLSFLMAVIGGFLAFMGVFAGISKWVAEPASRRVMAEHRNEGAMAHPEYIGRKEWDDKHTLLMNEIDEIKLMIARMESASHRKKEF